MIEPTTHTTNDPIAPLKAARVELLDRLSAGEKVDDRLDEVEDALERAERDVRRKAEREVATAARAAELFIAATVAEEASRREEQRAALRLAQTDLVDAARGVESATADLLVALDRFKADGRKLDVAANLLDRKPTGDKRRRAVGRFLEGQLHGFMDVALPPHNLRGPLTEAIAGIVSVEP